MNVNWHAELSEQWRSQARQRRLPHAVLLAGPPGVGKRALAAWIVAQKLGISSVDVPQFPFERPLHADLHWLEVPEDKQSIGIDQVRELIKDLRLTSYEGAGKAAVIEPADLMTRNAANSLLKTLEEPCGDTLLVLIADRTGHLPATVISRCQRIDLRVPAEQDGLEWLDRLHPGNSWLEPLRIAGYAPIAAIQAAEQIDTSAAMAREFAAVAAGQASPIDVAANWARIDPLFVLKWLSRQVQLAIRAASGAVNRAEGLAIPQSVLQHMDRRNLFCYLDTINRLRGQAGGSWNPQSTFEGLLIDWATGLREVRQ